MKQAILIIFLFFIKSYAFAVPSYIDKNINISLEEGDSNVFFPTSAAGIDAYSPSSVTTRVKTSTGLTNPSITDKIVKVTTGKENGGTFRNFVRIQAIGIGECRIVCSCSYDVPLNSTGGLANII